MRAEDMIRFSNAKAVSGEDGFALIISLLILAILTMMGVWATSTSTTELAISGNQKAYEDDFNVSEGGTSIEAADIGFATNPYYEVTDTNLFYKKLGPPPTNLNAYDPGSDMTSTERANLPASIDNVNGQDPTQWPRQNLLRDTTDNMMDYAYLVTYLYHDTPPKGYDAAHFSAYKFKINGARNVVIEVGGVKVGPKAAM